MALVPLISVRIGLECENTSFQESTSATSRRSFGSEVKPYFTPEWTQQNVTSMRGSLGALYRVWGDGKQMVKGDRTDYFGLSGYSSDQLKQMGYMVWMPPQPKGAFLGEGDTPNFINLIGNGLRAYEDPQWGGWGGRMHPGRMGFSPFGAPPPIMPADTSGLARGLAPAGSDAKRSVTAKTASADRYFELSFSRRASTHSGDQCSLVSSGTERLCGADAMVGRSEFRRCESPSHRRDQRTVHHFGWPGQHRCIFRERLPTRITTR